MDRRTFLGGAISASVPLLASSRSHAYIIPTAGAKGLSGIDFGVDYYAEDWPPERTEVDAKLMQAIGVNVVRLIDTNWERMEPQDGHHDFAWLDRVIEILHRHGIRAILGTSCYVPPAWLMHRHPEFYAVNKDGVRYRWGGMGWVCLNNPEFRKYIDRHVTALAEHYGRHPAVIGWQVDNELGGFGYTCYDTDYCVPKFQRGLKDKFGTIGELNRRMATVSYGHAYSDFDEVPLNWTLGSQAHQAPLELEAQRFFSANVTAHMADQAAILRRLSRQQWISHNITGPSRNGDWFQFAQPLDFMGYDSYWRNTEFVMPAFTADLVRGVNHGRPYVGLEMRSGYMGPYTLTDTITPEGLVRLWAWQTLAHGADGVVFFRWRMAVGGSEQYWQGLVDYDGKPNRAYHELGKMGSDLKTVGPAFAKATTQAAVAQIMSYDSLWALHVGGAEFPYFDQMAALNRSFRRVGLNVDVVSPQYDLSKYRVVLAPTLHVVDQALADRLEAFVAAGGVLVLTARSGVKTIENLGVELPFPGLLRKLAGATVPQYTMLADAPRPSIFGRPNEAGVYQPSMGNEISGITSDWQGNFKATVWADLIEPDDAKVLFRYTKDFYSGRAAVTLSEYGKGKVLYVGTIPDTEFYLELAHRCCSWAGIAEGAPIPEGVDYAIRRGSKGDVHFVMNFTTSPQQIAMRGRFRDLLKGGKFQDVCRVEPLDLLALVGESG